MFDLTDSVIPVPQGLRQLFIDQWSQIASHGTHWSAAERVAIAAAARRDPPVAPLPPGAARAARTIAASPPSIDRALAHEFIDELGEPGYVELVGVISCVVGVDTVTRLLGCGTEALPQPATDPAPPSSPRSPADARQSKAWVSTVGPPGPRSCLSQVPATNRAFNALLDRLYLTHDEKDAMVGRGGLSRAQIESVVVGVSFLNACFY